MNDFNEIIIGLMRIGAVSPCTARNDQYLSSIFLVPKPNGKKRFILNLKNLNKFIKTDHFKLEDLRTAIKLMTINCYMATCDLKDAYFLLNIHPDSRKYLRFQFNGKIYEFNVLPFGLNTAPFIFTKLMKPVIKLLRLAGYTSTIYLDDLFLVGYSYDDCRQNINTTVRLLTALGFIINYDKSNLQPSLQCKFLGFVLDAQRMIITLPEEKIQRITKEIAKFMSLRRCTIKEFAKLIGLLVSACPAVEYGWLYTKDLERYKYLNLKGHDDYNCYMNIPIFLHDDLKWWLRALEKPVNHIKDDTYSLELFSDASTTGWGAACGSETASGRWSPSESKWHINYLELLAAFFALKIFARDLHHCQILLRIDNSTAISYINRMGGIQFPHLTQVTKDIWTWCEARRIFVYAYYIKSSDNVIADKESRRNHPDIEWSLSNDTFTYISHKFGKPAIDLFASRINKKCIKYVAWQRDPDAFAINAFTISWSKIFFYAFPPFPVILKTLRKIVNDRAKGIIIVPLWPTQPWFPLFKSLLISKIVTLKADHNHTVLHCSSSHNIQNHLTLAAGILSGDRLHEKMSQNRLNK